LRIDSGVSSIRTEVFSSTFVTSSGCFSIVSSISLEVTIDSDSLITIGCPFIGSCDPLLPPDFVLD
jgi:hypothetical protein